MKRLIVVALGLMGLAGCAQMHAGPGGAKAKPEAPEQKVAAAPAQRPAERGRTMGPRGGFSQQRPAAMRGTITLTNGSQLESVGPIRNHSLGGRQFIAFDTEEGPVAVRIDQVAMIAGVDPGRLFAAEERREGPGAQGEDRRPGPGAGRGEGPDMRRGPMGGPGMRGGPGGPGGPGRDGPDMRGGPDRREMREGPGPRGEGRRNRDDDDDKGEKKGEGKKQEKKD